MNLQHFVADIFPITGMCVWPLMRNLNAKAVIVSTPGFLAGRRAELARGFTAVETHVGRQLVTAFVVPFDEWVTLPIHVDKDGGLDIAGNLDEDILIGIPENLPEAGRAAYVHSVVMELVTSVPVLAVIVEMIKMNADIRTNEEQQAHLLARIQGLGALTKHAEMQRWFEGKINALREVTIELRSYLK